MWLFNLNSPFVRVAFRMLLNPGAATSTGKGKLKSWIENKGRFPFNQTVRFEFSATSSNEWNSFFQNFQKRGQPHEVYPNFRNFFSRKFSFHSTLLPEILEFSVIWFALRKFNTFPDFLETFPENCCTICRCFQIFESFGWMSQSSW